MDKDYLIKKWLSDDLSGQEWEDFKKLDDFDSHMRLSEGAKKFKASNFVSPDEFEVFKAKLRSKAAHKTALLWPLLKIAGLVLISFAVYYVFFLNDLTQIMAPAGNKIVTQLPDDSEVILNAVSQISYNKEKWFEKREIKLEGEAFFKVSKGSTFEVLTPDDKKVSVLGTQFNVKNRKDFFEVVCYEGSVSVDYSNTSEVLRPGNVFRMLKGNVSRDSVQGQKPLWIENKSSFNQVPIYEVIRELERQYNVIVQVESIDVDRLFRGGFMHNDLDTALKSITIPLNLTYQIQSPSKIVLKNSE